MKMLKKYIIYFILEIFAFNLFALDSKTLLNNKWELNSKYPDISYEAPIIEFLKNGKYHISYYSRWNDYKTYTSEGTYKFKNDVLTINQPTKVISESNLRREKDSVPLSHLFWEENNYQCILSYKEENPRFDCLYYLSSEYFTLKSNEPQKEDAICYDILNRHYSDYEEGKLIKHTGKLYATDNLKLRYKPSLSERVETYYYRSLDDFLKENNLDTKYIYKYSHAIPVLLAGYVVDYDSYTYEKTDVDGLSAPWYRILLGNNDFWIYGGYIKEYTQADKETANQLLITSALDKAMFQEIGSNRFQKVYDNIATLSKEEVAKNAELQINIEGSFTEENSYIYKAYKEKRYDLFKPLKKAGYPIIVNDKNATVYKYIVDDNNLQAAKALFEAGYGINETEEILVDNEFDLFYLTRYLLKNGKKEMLEYFYSVGFDLLAGGSYYSEGGEPKCQYTSYFYAINNKDAIDFLIEKGLDINSLSIEGYFDGTYYYTTLDYAIKATSPNVDYIKSKGGRKASEL